MASKRYWMACLLALTSCLPKDTRPPPAEVTLQVQLPADLSLTTQADATTTVDFMTDDGWSVSLDRITVSLGVPEVFADETCSEYADAPYLRLLELTRPGSQRLGQIWGLNACKVDYTVDLPALDSVLGEGLTQADLDFMRNSVVPVSTESGPRSSQGMATRIRGSASKEGVSVHFDWGFSDRLEWTECQRVVAGEVEPGLPLVSNGKLDVSISIDPRLLFVQQGMPLMSLVASADQTNGDHNGVVSVSELTAVAVPGNDHNLAEVLRQTGYPALFRYGDGQNCKLNDPDF